MNNTFMRGTRIPRIPRANGTRTPMARTTIAAPQTNGDLLRSIDLAFGLIVVILNIVEITIISRIKRKKKIYEIFILSLSVTDLLFGVSNVLVSIIYLSNSARYDGVQEISYTTYFYFVLNSIFHLSWIAADRLWTVCKPFQHRVHATRKRAYILLAVTWIVSTIIAGSLVAADQFTETFTSKTTTITYENVTVNVTSEYLDSTISPTRLSFSSRIPLSTIKPNRPINRIEKRRRVNIRSNQEYQQTMQLVLSIFIILADALLIACYCIIIYLLKKKSKYVSPIENTKDRVSIVCIFIAVTFVLFTLPYALGRLIQGRTKNWATLILVSNSGLNSIIYFFRGKCKRYQDKISTKTTLAVSSTPSMAPLSTPINVRKEPSLAITEDRKLSTDF